MNIIEKLGITDSYDIFLANDNRNYSKVITENYEYIADSTAPVSEDEQKIIHNEIRIMGAAPEMLEALIKVQEHADSIYNTELSETYFKNIIEKATGKSWEEIKKLLK